jgi:hydroxymethylpyrimidine pyrophosphatase-like HAD family hydrolase
VSASRDAVLGALAEAEVALKLVENRGALMLLPAGISKGTGLKIALFGLGVSAADVLAIGDAENDFDLLDACGWSACPENARGGAPRGRRAKRAHRL